METEQTILVVDDASAIRRLICEILSQSGYRCLEAGNGPEALRLLEEGAPIDLLLTDIVMPQMSGRELARYVARLRPGLRILFMSGCLEEDTDSPTLSASAFIAKPFTARALDAMVRQVFASPAPA